MEEAGRIYRWDETVVSEKGDGESLGAAEDSKGESLVLELWKPGPLATSKSLEDVQVKSEILTRDDDNSNFPVSFLAFNFLGFRQRITVQMVNLRGAIMMMIQ